MTTYVVTYSHPDEEGWLAHVGPHVEFAIEGLIEDMTVTEWGPMFGALS